MRTMKDSGIPWIGHIPASWKVDKIKYNLHREEPRNPGNVPVLSLYRDYGVVPKDSRDDNHNVTSEDTSKYKYVRVGDFVINKMKAWQGSVAVSGHEGIVSPAYFVYRFDNQKLVRGFFHYLMRSCYKDEFRRLSGGIREGQWDLPSEALDNTLILLPPVDEQQRIADFLDHRCAEIDALTEDVRKEIETLQEYRRSLITEMVTKGLAPDAEMKDSGNVYLGQINSQWEAKRIKYLFSIRKDIAGYEGPTVLSITQKGIRPKNLAYGEGQQASDYSGYQLVSPGDFAMNHMDLLTGWVDISDQAGVTSPDYRVFRIRDAEQNNRRFFLYVMQMCYTNRIFYQLGHGVSGMGRWRLPTDRFLNFIVPVPSTTEQQHIADFLDHRCREIDSIIETKQQQIETLSEYRKSLIYEYVTGKKEVV